MIAFAPTSPSTTATCIACGQPLPWHMAPTRRKGGSAAAYPVCEAFACRRLFQEVDARSGAEEAFRRTLRWRVQAERDGESRRRAEDQRQQARSAAESREATAIFAAVAPDADLQLEVQSGHAPSRPLSNRRRRAYAAHLDAIFTALADSDDLPSQATAPKPGDRAAAASTLPGRLCGFCGGGCCGAGGDDAYLRVGTLKRVLAANPELDPAALRQTYLDSLPRRSLSKSCINHTRTGCALPPSLRSETCNAFGCDALKRLQAALASDSPQRTVAVLRRRQPMKRRASLYLNNGVVAGVILTEAESRPLAPPTPAGWPCEARED